MTWIVNVRSPGADKSSVLLKVGSKESAEVLAEIARNKMTKGKRRIRVYEHVEVVEEA